MKRGMKMDMPQIPDKNASFHFARFEKEYGSIGRMEPLCPGVYEVVTGPSEKHSFFGGEYIIVVGDTPAVSPEARAYGIPVPDDPDVLVYDSGEFFPKGDGLFNMKPTNTLLTTIFPCPNMNLWLRIGCTEWRSVPNISENFRSHRKHLGGPLFRA